MHPANAGIAANRAGNTVKGTAIVPKHLDHLTIGAVNAAIRPGIGTKGAGIAANCAGNTAKGAGIAANRDGNRVKGAAIAANHTDIGAKGADIVPKLLLRMYFVE
jgi:hypothetical protein